MSPPTPIKRVVLAGATGNLGPSILAALLSASYTITVLTQHSSPPPSLPSNPSITVLSVDYTSPTALHAALKDHDAVISTISSHATPSQLALITAAAAAGIQRFIPSEFGSDTLHRRTSALPVFAGKVLARQHLEATAAATPGFTYTLVMNGTLLDWGLEKDFLVDVSHRRARLFDGGRHEFDSTLLADVGRAVVGVLRNAEETANRAVYVRSARLTLRGLLDAVQEVTGKDGWAEEEVEVEGMVQGALEEMKTGGPNPMGWILPMLCACVFGGEKYGMPFDKCDNDLLEVKELSGEEIKTLVKEIVEVARK